MLCLYGVELLWCCVCAVRFDVVVAFAVSFLVVGVRGLVLVVVSCWCWFVCFVVLLSLCLSLCSVSCFICVLLCSCCVIVFVHSLFELLFVVVVLFVFCWCYVRALCCVV